MNVLPYTDRLHLEPRIRMATKGADDRLRAYLNRVVSGNPNIVLGPWCDTNAEALALLEEWWDVLKSFKLPDGLLDFEKSLKAKVGPMSVMKPLVNRWLDIEAYYKDVVDPGKPIDENAVVKTCQEFDFKLRLKSIQSTVDDMKLNTNSGVPFFSRRNNVVSIDSEYSNEILLGSYNPRDIAAVIGWRGQEGGPEPEDTKQRVIFMFPFSVNISELRVYQLVIEEAQKKLLVPAWISLEQVDDRVTHLFDTKDKSDLVVCTDFTRFDQHFNKNMQDAAQKVLYHMLGHTHQGRQWIRNVFGIKFAIPLILSDRCQVGWMAHGMGSGSGGTNADETLAHRCLQYEAARSIGSELNPNSMCLGDDGILSFPGISVKQVVSVYSKHGQEMNYEKQDASTTTCTYLRRWYSTKYRTHGKMRGVYSTCRALGRLLYQERYYAGWTPEAVAIRQLSILQNIEWHPLREKFAQWCMGKDKFRLGLDLPGFMDNLQAKYQEFKANQPSAVGYNMENLQPSNILDWWIVKYLREAYEKL